MTRRFPYFCYISSHGQQSLFPDNNQTRFSNFLQVPIQPRDTISNRIFVRLRSISFWHELDADSRQEDCHFLKVKVRELEHLPGSHELDQVLAIIPFSPIEKTDKYKLLEFEHKTFQPLRSLPLEQLTLSITDSKNKPLSLKESNTPTIVCMEMTDHDFSTDFSVTCFSKDSQNVGVKNTLYRFDHQLREELLLEDYEVALASVCFPPTLISKHKVWFSVTLRYHDQSLPPAHEIFAFDINQVKESKREFTKIMEYAVINHPFWSERFIVWSRSPPFLPNEEYDGVKDFYFNVFEKAKEEGTLFINFSDNFHLTSAIGEPYGQIELSSGSSQIFKGPFDFSRLYREPIALLTADIIENSFVGGQKLPLLRLIPLPVSLGGEEEKIKMAERFYTPEHPIYHPVKNHPFSFIAFELLNTDGSPHKMKELNTDEGLMIKLLFRRRKPL